MKTALVVSGGGSKGAFAVGAVRYLREAKGVRFDLAAGTSTGAFVAPLVATDELALLETLYTSVATADVLSAVSLETAWRRGYLYDTSPLEALVERWIDHERAQRILDSEVAAFLATVSVQTGRLTYFQTGRAAAQAGRGADLVRVGDRDTLLSAIVASANQPVFMPPVWIPPHAQPVREYMDGGVREYAPIDAAIANGAEEIYVIMHSPPPSARRVQESAAGSLPEIAGRALELLTDEIGEGDLRLATLYSGAVTYLAHVRANARALGLSAEQEARLFAGEDPFVGRRAVALHVIRPERPFPADGLSFEPRKMKEWVAWGARRARETMG